MPRSIIRTITTAIAVAALAAPTALARPADLPPAVAKAAAAEQQQAGPRSRPTPPVPDPARDRPAVRLRRRITAERPPAEPGRRRQRRLDDDRHRHRRQPCSRSAPSPASPPAPAVSGEHASPRNSAASGAGHPPARRPRTQLRWPDTKTTLSRCRRRPHREPERSRLDPPGAGDSERRGRDSNPRRTRALAGFQDERPGGRSWLGVRVCRISCPPWAS